MKNNTLAMLATISLAFSVATLLAYVDPLVCAGSQIQDLATCTNAAQQNLTAFAIFFGFGALTLIASAVRSRLSRKQK